MSLIYIGLLFSTRKRLKNLLFLDFGHNRLGQEASAILKTADFPRINKLDLSIENYVLSGIDYVSGVYFLKSAIWQQLMDLISINNNNRGYINWQPWLQDDQTLSNCLKES